MSNWASGKIFYSLDKFILAIHIKKIRISQAQKEVNFSINIRDVKIFTEGNLSNKKY
jgi:hypothetical protein